MADSEDHFNTNTSWKPAFCLCFLIPFSSYRMLNCSTLKLIHLANFHNRLSLISPNPIKSLSYSPRNTIVSVLIILNACCVNKILHGLAPLPLGEFIMLRSSASGRKTRASTRGDCAVLIKTAAGHSKQLDGTKIFQV